MTLKGINIKELKICKYNVYKKNLPCGYGVF